jgi:hypothetical protein
MSWPMRLSSGATIQTPFSFSRRPITWLLARETTSTMVPSGGRGGRCRSRAPARGRRAAPSAFLFRQEQIVLAVVRNQEAEAVAMAADASFDEARYNSRVV